MGNKCASSGRSLKWIVKTTNPLPLWSLLNLSARELSSQLTTVDGAYRMHADRCLTLFDHTAFVIQTDEIGGEKIDRENHKELAWGRTPNVGASDMQWTKR